MKRPRLAIFGVLIVSFLSTGNSRLEAGRLPEPWDSLPQIHRFVFAGTDLGLISMDHHHLGLRSGYRYSHVPD